MTSIFRRRLHSGTEDGDEPALLETAPDDKLQPPSSHSHREAQDYPRAREGWEVVHGRVGGWYYRQVR